MRFDDDEWMWHDFEFDVTGDSVRFCLLLRSDAEIMVSCVFVKFKGARGDITDKFFRFEVIKDKFFKRGSVEITRSVDNLGLQCFLDCV